MVGYLNAYQNRTSLIFEFLIFTILGPDWLNRIPCQFSSCMVQQLEKKQVVLYQLTSIPMGQVKSEIMLVIPFILGAPPIQSHL